MNIDILDLLLKNNFPYPNNLYLEIIPRCYPDNILESLECLDWLKKNNFPSPASVARVIQQINKLMKIHTFNFHKHVS